jgi:serine/threonine-protein kinase
MLIGTPEYLSPEQAETKKVDHRSDIYSLGVILYEMATGQRPFEGETALSIIRKHAEETPKDPKALNQHISVEFNSVIMNCLEKDPALRFQSAEEVHTALDNVEQGIPSMKRADPPKALTSKEITLTFNLKRLMLPMVITLALVIIAVVIMQMLPKKGGVSGRDKPAIAVLPFDNFSPVPEDAYFANGMQEQLVSTLAKIRALSVRGRTSVMRYRNQPKSPLEIAEELDVNYILEGSARIVGNQVSVTAILIDARNEEPIWSDEYDREFSVEEVLSIHREIAEQVTSQLEAVLTPEEHERIDVRPTESLAAYQAYLRGRFFQAKRTQDDLAVGMEYFQDAIEADPTYASAWAGLADSYIQLSGYASLPAHVAIPKAREAVKKALEFDQKSGEARLSLAWIDFHNEKGLRDLRPEYERALELSPDLSTAYHWYGWYLICLHQYEEGIALVETALDLDPLVSIYNASLGYFYLVRGELDAAAKQLEATLALDQTFPRAHWWLGQTLALKGEMDEAIEHISQAIELSDSNPQYLATLAWAYGLAGEEEKAEQVIHELEQEATLRFVPRYDLAVARIGVGDTDRALTALEESVKSNDSWLGWVSVDPRFATVREDPRFIAVLKSLGYKK